MSSEPISSFLPPPNPIMMATNVPIAESSIAPMKIVFNKPSFAIKDPQSWKRIRLYEGTLQEIYSSHTPLYTSIDNTSFNYVPSEKKRYFAGTFCDFKHILSDPKNPTQTIRDKSALLSCLKSISPQEGNLLLQQQQQTKSVLGQSPNNNSSTKFSQSLRFNSSFESGNLFAAYQVGPKEYDLILASDTNSKGNTQWFYFSVSNTTKNQIVRFNIVNLMKSDSHFNAGMLPSVFSQKACESPKNRKWTRAGFNSSYTKNSIPKEGTEKGCHYTLQFSYKFEFSHDTVYFAHCYPYTLTDLNNFLNDLTTSNPLEINKILTRKTLCETIGKNKCEVLLITEPKSSKQQPLLTQQSSSLTQSQPSDQDNTQKQTQRNPTSSISPSKDRRQQKKKDIVIIMARQHPGETPGSWMMEGIIEFLANLTNDDAKYLRSQCIFKIIPMANPDGVVCGNYRTDLSGVDLNRNWFRPSKENLPTIFAIKQLICQSMGEQNKIRYIIDLHGHSKKMNAFFYGNPRPDDPAAPRIFPLTCAADNPHIDFTACTFRASQSKQTTARVSLSTYLASLHTEVITLEASFYGYNAPTQQSSDHNVHFTTADYKNIGKTICTAIAQILHQEEAEQALKEARKAGLSSDTQSIISNCNSVPDPNVFTRLFRNFKFDAAEMIKQSIISDETKSTNEQSQAEAHSSGGSDSDPLADELTPSELNSIQAFHRNKNKTLRSISQTNRPRKTRNSAGDGNALMQQHYINAQKRSLKSIAVQTAPAPWLAQIPYDFQIDTPIHSHFPQDTALPLMFDAVQNENKDTSSIVTPSFNSPVKKKSNPFWHQSNYAKPQKSLIQQKATAVEAMKLSDNLAVTSIAATAMTTTTTTTPPPTNTRIPSAIQSKQPSQQYSSLSEKKTPSSQRRSFGFSNGYDDTILSSSTATPTVPDQDKEIVPLQPYMKLGQYSPALTRTPMSSEISSEKQNTTTKQLQQQSTALKPKKFVNGIPFSQGQAIFEDQLYHYEFKKPPLSISSSKEQTKSIPSTRSQFMEDFPIPFLSQPNQFCNAQVQTEIDATVIREIELLNQAAKAPLQLSIDSPLIISLAQKPSKSVTPVNNQNNRIIQLFKHPNHQRERWKSQENHTQSEQKPSYEDDVHLDETGQKPYNPLESKPKTIRLRLLPTSNPISPIHHNDGYQQPSFNIDTQPKQYTSNLISEGTLQLRDTLFAEHAPQPSQAATQLATKLMQSPNQFQVNIQGLNMSQLSHQGEYLNALRQLTQYQATSSTVKPTRQVIQQPKYSIPLAHTPSSSSSYSCSQNEQVHVAPLKQVQNTTNFIKLTNPLYANSRNRISSLRDNSGTTALYNNNSYSMSAKQPKRNDKMQKYQMQLQQHETEDHLSNSILWAAQQKVRQHDIKGGSKSLHLPLDLNKSCFTPLKNRLIVYDQQPSSYSAHATDASEFIRSRHNTPLNSTKAGSSALKDAVKDRKYS